METGVCRQHYSIVTIYVTYMETGVCRQHYSMNNRLYHIHGNGCLQTALFYEEPLIT